MDFADQLKQSVDIAQVIGEYVRLRKAGPARYAGLCPFHTEKTPSFSVNVAKQFYHCFGCKASGDVIHFVMEMEGLTFLEALKQLAERHGIPMPQRPMATDPESRLRDALYSMHDLALRAFQSALRSSEGSQARAYLQKRGLTSAIIEEFQLGYVDRSGQFLTRRLLNEGFTPEQLEKSGLVLQRQEGGFYDRFRNRLMFPLHNESGKVVGFAGRALADGDEPKYLNSPETSIYRKRNLLYNLHKARQPIRKTGYSILVEGYMDVIGLWAAGVQEVIASCGTALSTQQVKLLARHAPQVVVNFDPDTAGSNAAESSIDVLLQENARVRILELDADLDPDEYVKEHGVDTYRRRLQDAQSYFHWLTDRARKRFPVRTAEGRVEALKFLLPIVQRIPDRLERAAVANDVASMLGVDPGLVLDHFRKAVLDRREGGPAPQQESVPPVERMLLHALFDKPDLRPSVIDRLKSMRIFEQLKARRIFDAMGALHNTKPEFSFSDLQARLEDKDRTLLASVVIADEMNDHTGTEQDMEPVPERIYEQVMACLKRLEASETEVVRKEIEARIKDALRANRMEEALRLNEELNRLTRGTKTVRTGNRTG